MLLERAKDWVSFRNIRCTTTARMPRKKKRTLKFTTSYLYILVLWCQREIRTRDWGGEWGVFSSIYLLIMNVLPQDRQKKIILKKKEIKNVIQCCSLLSATLSLPFLIILSNISSCHCNAIIETHIPVSGAVTFVTVFFYIFFFAFHVHLLFRVECWQNTPKCCTIAETSCWVLQQHPCTYIYIYLTNLSFLLVKTCQIFLLSSSFLKLSSCICKLEFWQFIWVQVVWCELACTNLYIFFLYVAGSHRATWISVLLSCCSMFAKCSICI